ncbi:AAA family ATPase [Simiduia sp. 21SJ11W-1]|uniref:AAA family ATPase n=1 Tax=Simiduia sp. 21SJ11W-1 TaxID=2909669 RepID=UPI00209CD7B7|nr:AAA family ATPase [Simiduia sp. 21SJ11W-1]UTA47452.1 AAA family ATPase [Simiduia sp. 21SJ11W-1]
MARYCGEMETQSKFAATSQWRERCLLAGQSVLGEGPLWTLENARGLDRYFVNNLETGDGDFYEKLEAQLSGGAPAINQLAAEMLWFMQLCPSNITAGKKRETIARVWSWSGQSLNIEQPLLAEAVLDGIGSAGTSFNTNRWRELVYFIQFAKAFFALEVEERKNLLSDPWAFAEWLQRLPENESRQLRHMLLFLLFPDQFERIFGGADRRQIATAFSGRAKRAIRALSAMELDKLLLEIRTEQAQELGTEKLDFYVPPLRGMWRDSEQAHWLLSWNPKNYSWPELPELMAKLAAGDSVVISWSCANGAVAVGDKVWMARVGEPPKGIMAVGVVVTEPYQGAHWQTEKARAGEQAQCVDIELTDIRDVYKDDIIGERDLAGITVDNQNWTPQQSGIAIGTRSAALLEGVWKRLRKSHAVSEPSPATYSLGEAVNLILYGPPGTGKTFQLNRLKAKYVTAVADISREAWLSGQLGEHRWFDVVFMALADLGGKARVAEINEHPFIVQKARVLGRTANIRAQIWATLQTHTVEDSKTVGYNKRSAPYVFDKASDSQWLLAGDWQQECDDLVAEAKRLAAGPQAKARAQRYEFVTFHQAYSYEDFVEGIRPETDEDSGTLAYPVKPGVFKRICDRARQDPSNRYAIFIDEINRGNIAKIFGELITLVEKDKRVLSGQDTGDSGMTLTLPYSGETFGVPKNLDIYGTMNTADRSIALLDTALRRRFTFEEMMPRPSVIKGAGDDGYIPDGQGGLINLRELLTAMNRRIKFLLNRDMMLGHAYLTHVKTFDELRDVLLNQLVPLLQEYFYNDWHRIQLVLRDVGPAGEKLEPQIVVHELLNEVDVLGFDHEDFDDLVEYSIASRDAITPESIRKIYEVAN